MNGDGLDLWGLFFSAFVSSTLFPGGSEVVLAVVAARDSHTAPLLLAVATAGNALGGMTSWGIGRVLPAARLERPRLKRAAERVRRHGSPVLLLSWLPVVGDPLCVAAGWLRVHWLAACVYITVGKALRYAAVLWVV